MKRHKAHLFAVAAVTAWGIFAYAYLGFEDGSDGLSPFGWLQALFFMPGVLVFQALKGSPSNADLPLAAGLSWLGYTIFAAATAWAANKDKHK